MKTAEGRMVPVPLEEWIAAQVVDDDLLWKGAWRDQVQFVRGLLYLVAAGLHHTEYKDVATVISTHTSKSCRLPVYSLARPDLGLELVLRHNFYNWKLSVLSEKPIDVDLSGLCHTTSPVAPEYTGSELSPVYFEGFPSDLIFSYYEETDRRRFSMQLGREHSVWTAVFLIMRSVGAIRPLVWHTRESHRKMLDEEYGRTGK